LERRPERFEDDPYRDNRRQPSELQKKRSNFDVPPSHPSTLGNVSQRSGFDMPPRDQSNPPGSNANIGSQTVLSQSVGLKPFLSLPATSGNRPELGLGNQVAPINQSFPIPQQPPQSQPLLQQLPRSSQPLFASGQSTPQQLPQQPAVPQGDEYYDPYGLRK